jgi:hypothetical protein
VIVLVPPKSVVPPLARWTIDCCSIVRLSARPPADEEALYVSALPRLLKACVHGPIRVVDGSVAGRSAGTPRDGRTLVAGNAAPRRIGGGVCASAAVAVDAHGNRNADAATRATFESAVRRGTLFAASATESSSNQFIGYDGISDAAIAMRNDL